MRFIPYSNKAIHRRLGNWSLFLAIGVTIIALSVLAGWEWNIDLLKRPLRGMAAMNPTTAVLFLFTAISFIGLTFPSAFAWQRSVARMLAVLVLLTGTACLASYVSPVFAGADQLVFPGRVAADGQSIHHARMAINTALGFILISFSLFLLPSDLPSDGHARFLWADLPALLVGALSLLSCIGFLYRVKEYSVALRYFPMAIPTAICFLFLALACLFACPERGIIREFSGPLTGSYTGRRLLPFALFVPIVLGLLRLYGYWLGYFTIELGVTLLVLSIIICFLLVIWFNAMLLNKRDILKKTVEEALTASESRWQALVSSVKDYAIYLIDPDGKVASWNEGARAIKGYSPAEVIGKPISIFYTPEDIDRGRPDSNLREAERLGRHYSEGWRVRKDGSRFWAEVVLTAIYDEHHRLRNFAKITRDTTEQKLAREKIAYQARLIEDTSDAIYSTDVTYHIKSWNRAAETLYGYSAAEVMGKSAREVIRTRMDERIRASERQQLEEQGYWKGEVDFLHRSGTQKTILQSVSGTRDAEGRREGFVIVCRDVTEWKKAELQLRKFNEELEQQVRQKTEAISRSNAELRDLASHLQDVREEERAAMAREIHDELGQQLTGLKMDLSWVARKLNGGEVAGIAEKVNETSGLLDDTIRTVRKIATELRPSILDDLGLLAAIDWQSQEFEKRSGIPTVFRPGIIGENLDPALKIGLFRICQESLTNVARHAAASKVLIVLDQDGGKLVLRVADDGKGMDIQKNGVGVKKTLGLLGMKERAQMMGGRLDLTSAPGQGLTLVVTVPIRTTA